ncbi:ATP-binding cassette domain-containing protein [Microbacterium sp. ET2]|uniref:ABC transporter ATP-binding protein n=1 Tax=Microbacterium albipurpureum TaxID=3050384 RepID=UPI00259C7685|nr:ATP-binding cassette domain-containing protein [Microbacterium sp. ET2 (Ac-2212)]WJL94529.1 ATP-binding cassette domain-containing protein [Microbacterium sp. ET2 (Ac-2212)]
MPDGHALDFSGVTKRFGAVAAVDGFTARVEPGVVTGFLGPNGAGKTTTLRMLLGLVRPDAGAALIGGERYAQLRHPLQTVGAVLEASSYHPGRSAANHLKVYAQAASLPESRVDEVLGLVGLADVAGRRIGGFSLGMRQRLGLAYALLGDPGVLVLDEPSNGLDPEGIKWMRGFLRQLATEGRTVFVSSHLLAEVAQTVDALLIISRGRLVFQGEIADLADPTEFATVVDAPDRAALVAAMAAAGIEGEVLRTGLTVRGHTTEEIGRVAADAGVALSSLQRKGPAFEEVFLELVNGVRTHPSASGLPKEPEPQPEPQAGPEPEPEPQPASAVEPGSAVEPAAAPEGAPDPAAAPDRSFSVASTGVIDVISPEVDGPGGHPTTDRGEAR